MSDNEIEEGSFIPDPKVKPQKRTPSADANSILFKLMREIRDVIKENTEALNSLLTVVLTQKPISVTTKPMTDRPELIQHEESKTYEDIGAIPLPKPEPELEEVKSESMSDVDVIKGSFPDSLASLLEFTFEREGKFVKVKPRQFLGSNNFAKIASIVRELGGDYISAGKESHFRIHKQK